MDYFRDRLFIVFIINLLFALIEWFGGAWVYSLAIQSDAIHDFGDSLILGSAFLLERWSYQRSSQKHSFGLRRLSIISSLFAGIILIAGCVYVFYQAFWRFYEPGTPFVSGMIGLAFLGLIFNLLGFCLLGQHDKHSHHDHSYHHNHNQNIIRWHLLEDVLGWAAVLFGAIIIYFTNWYFIDPILSLLIAIFILFNAGKSLKPVFQILLQASPDNVVLERLKSIVLETDGVMGVHDFHLWTLDGDRHVLTLHVVVKEEVDLNQLNKIKQNIRSKLLAEYNEMHITIETELESEGTCGMLDCIEMTH